MKKTTQKKTAKGQQQTEPMNSKWANNTTNQVLKIGSLWLTIGICAGLLAGPHLPPEALQWALFVFKALVSGALKSLAGKLAA